MSADPTNIAHNRAFVLWSANAKIALLSIIYNLLVEINFF